MFHKDLHVFKMMTQFANSFGLSQNQLFGEFRFTFIDITNHPSGFVGRHSSPHASCSTKCRFETQRSLSFHCSSCCRVDSTHLKQAASISWKAKSLCVVSDDSVDGDIGLVHNGARKSPIAVRPSRISRVQAQKALLDYLHVTRGLRFLDSEHISKNSPKFLQKLMEKVGGGEEEIGRLIRKFLLYHPINEFEPFFESLGVKESEIHDVLPVDFMFLDEDESFLRNYHLLCDYGVPRSRIGRMYVEASDIFRCEPHVLMAWLEAYEQVGLSVPNVIKLVSCCPLLLVGGDDQDFASVFESLKGMGFEPNWIIGCLSESGSYRWDQMAQMLGFLKEMGCGNDDAKALIGMHPWFLFVESGRKVYVVVAILLKLGLDMENILSLFLRNPQILSGNFVKNMFHSIQFLCEIGMEVADVVKIICAYPNLMGFYRLKKPGEVLSGLDLEPHELCDIIIKDPNQLAEMASRTKMTMLATHNRTHPLEKHTFLRRLGFLENSDEMVAAQKLFRGRGDQLEERFEVLVNAGFSFLEACIVTKKAPQILNQGVDVLEKKIDYLVNCAGYPLNSLITFPTYLCYNLDKIKARVAMLQWLKQKGMVKRTVQLGSVIAISTERFRRSYVNLLPEGPDMWDRLNQSSSS